MSTACEIESDAFHVCSLHLLNGCATCGNWYRLVCVITLVDLKEWKEDGPAGDTP